MRWSDLYFKKIFLVYEEWDEREGKSRYREWCMWYCISSCSSYDEGGSSGEKEI